MNIIKTIFYISIFIIVSCNTNTQNEQIEDTGDYSTSTTAEDVRSSEDIVAFNMSDYSNEDVSFTNLIDSIPSLGAFSEALKNTDIFEDVDLDEQQYTIFAPSDSAFREFYDQNPEIAKMDKPEELEQIIKFHIVTYYSNTYDMKDEMNYNSLQGKNLIVEIEEEDIWINGAEIIEKNIRAEGAMIHIIDKVLVPAYQEDF